ncbi:hypothetical protein E3T54_03795 [Cryobacterium sp. Sr8]|uniref:chemotaxis protein CheW n=1 Tax=Cryobacterium sp. Sr8 TaxID=1259203 RepID=UPI00106B5EB6|nr:chemotaxis protein CheW [Cryobacterium sp. Sr8]TFD80194.1 hypothetical protein E3T54_03795 [Cryobacterium sp. Sr8]
MTDLHAVLFPVGVDLYAVPIERIEEVVVAPTLTRLVTAPSHVLGLFNLRGQIVPLIDAAALLGLGSVEPAAFVVVLQSRQGLIGLAVTDLPERVILGAPVGTSELAGTVGCFLVRNRVAVLLEPDSLLAGALLDGERPRSGQRAARRPSAQLDSARTGDTVASGSAR